MLHPLFSSFGPNSTSTRACKYPRSLLLSHLMLPGEVPGPTGVIRRNLLYGLVEANNSIWKSISIKAPWLWPLGFHVAPLLEKSTTQTLYGRFAGLPDCWRLRILLAMIL